MDKRFKPLTPIQQMEKDYLCLKPSIIIQTGLFIKLLDLFEQSYI